MTFEVVSILDLIREYGEQTVLAGLRSFECPRNAEVESFLLNKAIQSAKLKQSVSYLVKVPNASEISGYFTLVLKPVEIPRRRLSASKARIVQRFSKLNKDADSYTVAAYLIAQFAKNFSVCDSHTITGDELMNIALRRIIDAQKVVGGKLIFLECEKGKESLKKFYERNKFVSWSERTESEDGVAYEQMFTILDGDQIGQT